MSELFFTLCLITSLFLTPVVGIQDASISDKLDSITQETQYPFAFHYSLESFYKEQSEKILAQTYFFRLTPDEEVELKTRKEPFFMCPSVPYSTQCSSFTTRDFFNDTKTLTNDLNSKIEERSLIVAMQHDDHIPFILHRSFESGTFVEYLELGSYTCSYTPQRVDSAMYSLHMACGPKEKMQTYISKNIPSLQSIKNLFKTADDKRKQELASSLHGIENFYVFQNAIYSYDSKKKQEQLRKIVSSSFDGRTFHCKNLQGAPLLLCNWQGYEISTPYQLFFTNNNSLNSLSHCIVTEDKHIRIMPKTIELSCQSTEDTLNAKTISTLQYDFLGNVVK